MASNEHVDFRKIEKTLLEVKERLISENLVRNFKIVDEIETEGTKL